MPTVSQRSMPSRLELAATMVNDFTETFLLPLSGIKCIAKEIVEARSNHSMIVVYSFVLDDGKVLVFRR